MLHDHLKLNDDNTEFRLIGTKQQLAKVNISSITVGNDVIQAHSCLRNLGRGLTPRFARLHILLMSVVQLAIICVIFAASVSISVPRILRP